MDLPGGRWASSTRPSLSISATAETRTMRMLIWLNYPGGPGGLVPGGCNPRDPRQDWHPRPVLTAGHPRQDR